MTDCECGAIPSLTDCVCGGIRPCGKHEAQTLTIGLFPVEGETESETYAKWARKIGRNPYCGRSDCPEAKP